MHNKIYVKFTDGSGKNGSYKIQETLPQYFHGEVLQRNLGSNSYFGTIKFQVAFNLAVVWMIVFVALSKGLRSYGKVIIYSISYCIQIVTFQVNTSLYYIETLCTSVRLIEVEFM